MSQYLRKNILAFEEVLLITQQAETLLKDNEFEISSAHILQLVNSSNCSSYDCELVALAQHLDVQFITTDKQILREFPAITKSLDSFFS